MESKKIIDIQTKLKQLRLYSGEVDGVYGPGTKVAIQIFQKGKDLVSDGVVGPNTLKALGLEDDFSIDYSVVSKMFPGTPIENIKTHLPFILNALKEFDLLDKDMLLMALSTIRAETSSFKPISEGKSQYNTSSRGAYPFDLYDNRRDLGNRGYPDGLAFKGRGFIQLTGRSNYETHGKAIGVDLIDNPELANDPKVASKLLASFLKSKEKLIRDALKNNDIRKARRLVNGGSHGLTEFQEAFNKGRQLV